MSRRLRTPPRPSRHAERQVVHAPLRRHFGSSARIDRSSCASTSVAIYRSCMHTQLQLARQPKRAPAFQKSDSLIIELILQFSGKVMMIQLAIAARSATDPDEMFRSSFRLVWLRSRMLQPVGWASSVFILHAAPMPAPTNVERTSDCACPRDGALIPPHKAQSENEDRPGDAAM